MVGRYPPPSLKIFYFLTMRLTDLRERVQSSMSIKKEIVDQGEGSLHRVSYFHQFFYPERASVPNPSVDIYVLFQTLNFEHGPLPCTGENRSVVFKKGFLAHLRCFNGVIIFTAFGLSFGFYQKLQKNKGTTHYQICLSQLSVLSNAYRIIMQVSRWAHCQRQVAFLLPVGI